MTSSLELDLGPRAKAARDQRRVSEVFAKTEPAASSVNTMLRSEDAQRFAGILMEIGGADALAVPDPEPAEYRPDRWPSDFLTTPSFAPWGDTAQVQRNIIDRVLGLPTDPSDIRATTP